MSIDYRVARRADMPGVYRLRMEVFVAEQAVPIELERDERDGDATHVVATATGHIIGTGRLLAPDPCVPDAAPHVGRIAVARAWRGQGVGAGLMRILEAEALARYGVGGRVRVELAAQVGAIPFYQRLGYEVHGPVYLDAGIEHRDAWKVVSAQ